MSDDMVLVEHEDAPALVPEGAGNSNDDNVGEQKESDTAGGAAGGAAKTTVTSTDETESEKDDAAASADAKPDAKPDAKADASADKPASTTTQPSADSAKKDESSEPQPLQIVSIGSKEDAFAFKFHEDKLVSIMSKIPPGWKVAVVTVVGAFRTGKSFLLTWFLRYLHFLTHPEDLQPGKPWFQQTQTLGEHGFDWRGGSERHTTGIWMWSQPHFVKRKTAGGGTETIAVVLVDSQGMFDNETTMSLTASIFGLSTLLSSYQIYNVDKMIQEDNLQQLALFSEYARLALDPESDEDVKPFQRMEFLVRDWQHFEEEDGDLDLMEKEMAEYLDQVIADRNAKDLQETREQIVACYKTMSCFGLCHPGMQVVKKKYKGDVDVIEEEFLLLLDRFCQRVFHADNLETKQIQGRSVTAAELGAYIKAYAEMFASGAKFPEASTMLEATAAANNTNATQLAINLYKDTMNRIAGPKCSNYIRPLELKDDHKLLVKQALAEFDAIATFGSKRSIDDARNRVKAMIAEEFEVYESLNTARNPLAGLEMYAIPIAVASLSFILRWIADTTCSPYSTICKTGSDFFSHLYAVVVTFLLIVGLTKAKQVKEFLYKLRSAGELVSQGGKVKKD